MSSKVYKDTLKELIRKEVAEMGGSSKAVKRILGEARLQELTYRIELLIKAGASEREIYERIVGEIKASIPSILSDKPEFKDRLYREFYQALQDKGEESITWGELYEEIYEEEDYQNEIFVRLIEEQERVEITSPTQLQELTGITAVYKDDTPADALRHLSQTFTQAMYYRYFYHLKRMLQEGAKYKDLLQVEPEAYSLPQTWGGCLASDKRNSILWAIALEYLMGEKKGFKLTPDLRAIAKELEAPYSEIMEAYNIIND